MKRCVSFLLVMLVLGGMSIQAQMMAPPTGNSWGTTSNRDDNGNARDYWARARLTGILVDYLDLSVEQSEEFFPLWRSYNNGIEKRRNESRELFGKIMSSVDDEKIKTDDILKLVDDYEKLKEDEKKQRDEFYKRARKILADRQYIKLLMFPDLLSQEVLGRYPQQDQQGQQGQSQGWLDKQQ